MNEYHVDAILDRMFRVESIVEAFSDFIVNNPDLDKECIEQGKRELFDLFGSLNQPQQIESELKQYLMRITQTNRPKSIRIMFEILETAVIEKGVLAPKAVCDALTGNESLSCQNALVWNASLRLIRRVIHLVDYKAVREIMKSCRELFKTIPDEIPYDIQTQADVLYDLVACIVDRDSCLLPAYLLVNEIQKAYPDNTNYPHWKLVKLFVDYVESFKYCAQFVSLTGQHRLRPIIDHSSFPEPLMLPWRLDPNTLRFLLKGILPYERTLLRPQCDFLRYVLEQAYSRDTVCAVLGLQKQQKQRCVALEDQLVEIFVNTMERLEQVSADDDGADAIDESVRWPWLHLASQIIYFVLFQFACFSNIVLSLHQKLTRLRYRKGRDHLMWILLQFISGSIQRNPLSNFLPVLRLIDLLYKNDEPLPMPDISDPRCTHQLAVTSIWIHLTKKSQIESPRLRWTVPYFLENHYEFLQKLIAAPNLTFAMDDFRIPLLCNAFSTNQEFFTRPMAALVDAILGNQKCVPNVLSAGGASGSGTGGVSGGGNGAGGAGATGTGSGSSMSGNNGIGSSTSGGNASTANGVGATASGSVGTTPTTNQITVPISMEFLDSLTVHTKMSLIHSILSHIIKQAQSKCSVTIVPSVLETYSRLLVYTEIESLGIKGFITQLLPTVFKSNALGILHILLEMFAYRMHHNHVHYRVQLLSHLHSIGSGPQTNHIQLFLCIQNTALRLITGLGHSEAQQQLSRLQSEAKLISSENEELNRILVLTLARSMHITGTFDDGKWCLDLLSAIMSYTPFTWPSHTLELFPKVLRDFYVAHPVPIENKQQLTKAIDEEFRNWSSMDNENDIIGHFSVRHMPPLFLCIVWKMIMETDRVSPVAYKILERIGGRQLSRHLRKFCDYLIFQYQGLTEKAQITMFVEKINDMVWKYNIVTLDRLVLCLALRAHEDTCLQIGYCFIHLLLLMDNEFRSRCVTFFNENSPDHWKQSDWHEKHVDFHAKYPERFVPEEQANATQFQSLPFYFSNVCLRFLPVLDILIHRFIEIPNLTNSLEVLLSRHCFLYKFHDRPITFLYNTLHYYESKLRDQLKLKTMLVVYILGSFKAIRPRNWALSEEFQANNISPPSIEQPASTAAAVVAAAAAVATASSSTTATVAASSPQPSSTSSTSAPLPDWHPGPKYYYYLLKRFVDTLNSKILDPTEKHLKSDAFPFFDFRFHEFPNAGSHALYVTCVELMALPFSPRTVITNLVGILVNGSSAIFQKNQHYDFINVIGLIMANMPQSYWVVLQDLLVDTFKQADLAGNWTCPYTPMQLFNFEFTRKTMLNTRFSMMLAIMHSVWHHGGVLPIETIQAFVRERLRPEIRTEPQLLYLCHLIGPFLQRMSSSHLNELTGTLYEIVAQVDRHMTATSATTSMQFLDPICDLLYHIKYMYVGDSMKSDLETIVRSLSPKLQLRLRFIAHLSANEIAALHDRMATTGTRKHEADATNDNNVNASDHKQLPFMSSVVKMEC